MPSFGQVPQLSTAELRHFLAKALPSFVLMLSDARFNVTKCHCQGQSCANVDGLALVLSVHTYFLILCFKL